MVSGVPLDLGVVGDDTSSLFGGRRVSAVSMAPKSSQQFTRHTPDTKLLYLLLQREMELKGLREKLAQSLFHQGEEQAIPYRPSMCAFSDVSIDGDLYAGNVLQIVGHIYIGERKFTINSQ